MDDEAAISSLVLTDYDIGNSYKIYCIWEKDSYSWLTVCSIDRTSYRSIHTLTNTLADDLGCFIENANYLSSSRVFHLIFFLLNSPSL